jgi:hypothetical protein
MSNLEDQKKLENIIKQMLSPLKGLPFNLVIKSICGHDVIRFNENNHNHKNLLNKINAAIIMCCEEVNKTGIIHSRANEVGNKIEPYLKNALSKIEGFTADTPTNTSGKRILVGYPDIQLNYGNNTCYIECKTYNIKSIDSPMRSFYLSPSEDFKITKTGIHFIVSFQMIDEGKVDDGNSKYIVKSWKILDAYNLECDVKYEFNSDNKRMYSKDMILREGDVRNY